MNKLTRALIALAVLVVGGVAAAAENPLHNYVNPYDVDGNIVISPHDFLLIVNQIQRQSAGSPLAAASITTYYWDTNNDNRVSPIDGLLVVNRLLQTPEPGSIVLAGVGLAALGGFCWRKKRNKR